MERGIAMRIDYGDNANQFGDLTLPDTSDPAPVVVLIHGGFWRTGFGLGLMEPLVPSLVGAGYAVWNVEYRRVGAGSEGGGGYPGTFDDLAAAIDALAEMPGAIVDAIDLERVATVGHSAGGHLAAWLASRSALPTDAPWSSPVVRPILAVSQAGVLDLDQCIAEGVGGTACADLLGGEDLARRIELTSPVALVPIGAEVVAIHGTADRIVPINQSEAYVIAASATGQSAVLRSIDGADHFAMIDPGHAAWSAVLATLADEFGGTVD